MNEIRKMRLESQIQRELSDLILKRRIKDERIGFVSISRVDLAPDLSVLTVFVSLFGSEQENSLTWTALKQNGNFFQSSLGRNLRLRVTPRLSFEVDESIKEGDRILNLLEEGAKKGDSGPEAEQS